MQNGKYVSPAPLEENVKLSPYVEGAVLDGRNMVKTYLIIHPNMKALKTGLTAANVKFSSDDAEMCKEQNVKNWLLTELKTNNMVEPAWKRYEVADKIILDHEEWTTDNDLLTPSMKVKLRNLLTKHDDAINNL